MPILYRTVHFLLPGNVVGDDALLERLERFSDPTFKWTSYTDRVIVSGTWYQEFEDMEVDLALRATLSPAVRMLNALISVCLSRMPELRKFVWDIQLAPTQTLISSLALRPALENLQVRLATDHTPSPYFHPAVHFQNYPRLTTLTLVQVDKSEILFSINNVLNVAPQLKDLTVVCDVDAQLSLGTLFSNHFSRSRYPLTSLTLVGFVNLNNTPRPMWEFIQPKTLNSLTVQIGGRFAAESYGNFWASASENGFRPEYLATNLVNQNMTSFLGTFAGLKSLILLPDGICGPRGSLATMLHTLSVFHLPTLKILGLHPPGRPRFSDEYLLSSILVQDIVTKFPHLIEFAFSMREDAVGSFKPIWIINGLRVVHIRVGHAEGGNGSSTHSGSPLVVGPATHIDQHHRELMAQISAIITEPGAPMIRYVAFGDGPIYRIRRNPVRWDIVTTQLGLLPDTGLFRDRVLDWLEDVIREK